MRPPRHDELKREIFLQNGRLLWAAAATSWPPVKTNAGFSNPLLAPAKNAARLQTPERGWQLAADDDILMVQDKRLIVFQMEGADPGGKGIFASPMMVDEAAGKGAEDEASDKGKDEFSKHGIFSLGLKQGDRNENGRYLLGDNGRV